ncbi:MAG: hypothetical protein ACJ76N_08665 [Thermoanaerobaculia bacterium]
MATSAKRNRLNIQACDKASGADWSPGFFEQLSAVDPETVAAVEELLLFVRRARTSKLPVKNGSTP